MSLADAAPEARPATRAPEPRAGSARGGRCPFHNGDAGRRPRSILSSGCNPACNAPPESASSVLSATRLPGFATVMSLPRRSPASAVRLRPIARPAFAILDGDEVCRTSEDELRLLGAAMFDAGLTDDYDTLIAGQTLSHAIDVVCPVTGRDTSYAFFSVAFCRNAADPRDPLYDPSLSAPFTAVNTTSDSFAFARFVHDHALKAWGLAPYEMTHDREAVELLFRRCVVAWQNMSITTIQNYSRTTVDPARGVHLSDDQTRWYAAHNDPVFAELEKCPHVHEMPVAYASRLTAKWSATLFDGRPYEPGRDGQAGGQPVSANASAVERLSRELFEL